jgi:hypothetical protein
LNDNHPVLNALRQQLAALRNQYRIQPDEHTRYRLVRHEQLMAQWAPLQDLSA